MGKLWELTTSPENNFHNINCKISIAIFAGRVTWNYAYSPFKGRKDKWMMKESKKGILTCQFL